MSYQIKKSDIHPASQVLGKAFIEYPIFTYILPNRASREKKIRFLFVFLINLGMHKGEVTSPSNNIEGVSIWINSSTPKPSIFRIFRSCLVPLFLRVSPFSAYRFIKIGILKEKKRKEILKGSYLLLDIIGISPGYQNQGHARKMIESKLSECDNLSVSCYLETSDKTNITFYEKFHFQLYHKYQLSGVNVYCLLRESQKTTIQQTG